MLGVGGFSLTFCMLCGTLNLIRYGEVTALLAAERRRVITERIKATGQVVVSTMSAEFQVSEETIRRDLEWLEKEGIAQGIAEAEDEVLLGVLRNCLYNAVLHPDGVLGDAVVVYPRPAVALVEEESAPWENKAASA